MKNALILHCTDFSIDHRNHISQTEWFPWLKTELDKLGYTTWLPDLPEPWHPDLERYWSCLKNFNYNKDTVIIGHSSGGSMVFGLLNKLPVNKKIKLAISVAGFYKDEGWNCEGLFTEKYDWQKIKGQAGKIYIIYSDNDPYVKPYHARYFAENININPILIKGKKHFNLEASIENKQFPELLEIINKVI